MQPSVYKEFWKYCLPTVAAMLVNGLYQVVDGIFIGRFVGADGLAAINVAWPVIAAILGIGMMVGVGAGALTSIKLGEQDDVAAKKMLTTGLFLLLLLMPIIAVILVFFSDNFIAWQGAEGEVKDLALQYLDVLIVSCIFTLGSISFPFFLRNDNSPNLATLLMVIGAITNIVLDYVFIVVFDWQLTGAALATGIAQMAISLLGIWYFFSPKAKLRLHLSDLKIDLFAIPKIFVIGMSSFFMYIYVSAMVAFHNSLFTQYASALWLGAYAMVNYVVTVYYLVAEGIANGVQPLISFNHGARNQDNIKKLLKISMGISVIGGIAFILISNLFAAQMISIFNDEDNALIDAGVQGIRLHMFALFLDGFLVIAAAYYQSINKGAKALFVTIGNMLVQIPFLLLMPQLLGVTGIWLAFPLSNIALSLVVIWMLWQDLKKRENLPPLFAE